MLQETVKKKKNWHTGNNLIQVCLLKRLAFQMTLSSYRNRIQFSLPCWWCLPPHRCMPCQTVKCTQPWIMSKYPTAFLTFHPLCGWQQHYANTYISLCLNECLLHLISSPIETFFHLVKWASLGKVLTVLTLGVRTIACLALACLDGFFTHHFCASFVLPHIWHHPVL